MPVGRKLRAGVEAEPTDPQHHGTDIGQHQIVRGEVVTAETDALAAHDGNDEASDTSVDMHHGAASEVELPSAAGAGTGAAPEPCGPSADERR